MESRIQIFHIIRKYLMYKLDTSKFLFHTFTPAPIYGNLEPGLNGIQNPNISEECT